MKRFLQWLKTINERMGWSLPARLDSDPSDDNDYGR